MDIISILLVAIGLSMDSLAVAIAIGLSIESKLVHAIKIGLFFGGFQALMMILGWLMGLTISEFISWIDHWIAFALLSFIGTKMIYEAVEGEEEIEDKNPLKLYTLLMVSIATSIDSLAVGFSFSFLEITVLLPAAITGLVCFIISFTGSKISNSIGRRFGGRIRIVGGIILISIGLRILIEHLLG